LELRTLKYRTQDLVRTVNGSVEFVHEDVERLLPQFLRGLKLGPKREDDHAYLAEQCMRCLLLSPAKGDKTLDFHALKASEAAGTSGASSRTLLSSPATSIHSRGKDPFDWAPFHGSDSDSDLLQEENHPVEPTPASVAEQEERRPVEPIPASHLGPGVKGSIGTRPASDSEQKDSRHVETRPASNAEREESGAVETNPDDATDGKWHARDTEIKVFKYAAENWIRHWHQCSDQSSAKLGELASQVLATKSLVKLFSEQASQQGHNFPRLEAGKNLALACYFGIHQIVKLADAREILPPHIHWAAYMGRLKCVQGLVQKVNTLEKPSQKQFWDSALARDSLLVAAARRDWSVIKELVGCKQMDINQTGDGNRTILAIAVAEAQSDVVSSILATERAKANKIDDNGTTAIFCTLIPDLSRSEQAKTCLEHLLNYPKPENWNEKHPNFEAATAHLRANKNEAMERYRKSLAETSRNQRETVRKEAKVRLDALEKRAQSMEDSDLVWANALDRNERNVLSHACAQGRTDLIEVILEKSDMDVNAQDNQGRTPLMWAIFKRQEESAKLLMEFVKEAQSGSGLDVNLRDKTGRNAISWAVTHASPGLLKKMVDKYPDAISTPDIETWTPFAWTLQPPGYLDNAKVLIKKLRHDELRGAGGLRMFRLAVRWDVPDIATLLIDEGVFPINWKDTVDGVAYTALSCVLSHAREHSQSSGDDGSFKPRQAERDLIHKIQQQPGFDASVGGHADELESFLERCDAAGLKPTVTEKAHSQQH
jgi:ankyrin repeat protein